MGKLHNTAYDTKSCCEDRDSLTVEKSENHK